MTVFKTTLPWPTILTRAGMFALMWWILSEGDMSSWWIGVPAVLLAVMTSALLLPPVPLVWLELLRFIPMFLLRSLLGGGDVAWRVFHSTIPIAPALVTYPLRLPEGLPRLVMANTVSLLPGTLSTELGPTYLTVHVLSSHDPDKQMNSQIGKQNDILTELATVEHYVARLFGISLKFPEGGH